MSSFRFLAAAIALLIVFPVQAKAMKLDYDIYAGGLFLVSGEMKLTLGSGR